jgi:hypothetical protein
VTAAAAAKPTGPGHNAAGMTCNHYALYRMSCEQYEALRARAAGRCELCKIPEEQTRRGFLVIDHFHGRNGGSFIRGMLCDWCNTSVMQCADGIKAWGRQNRPWEDAAREYERNPWQQPSEEALRQLAARTEKMPKYWRRAARLRASRIG